MLNKETVYNNVVLICDNFDMKKTEEDLQRYCRAIFPILLKNNVSDEEFHDAAVSYMERTQGSNFNKLPSVGDYLALIHKTPKSVEEMARQETNNAFNAYTGLVTKFEHPVTNYVIKNCCGGLDNFIQEYVCKYKENKSSVPFRKKEFMEDWIMAYENNNQYHGTLSCAGYIPASSSNVILVESTQKLEESMLEDLRSESEKKPSILIQDLAKNMKG